MLAARGDLWAGGIGTVTYVDTPTVVAFGHPAYYEGDTGLYLCNAWIDGVWPSTYMAYKLGRPAAVRGTLTQDRLAGIVGIDGIKPVEIPDHRQGDARQQGRDLGSPDTAVRR